ncbi:type VI secretion system-associated protein TagO [Tateyamaria sp.]|uniref:type VI secretion system-associated protein TagO n=1 Tax=Tateyamaria sp. TaxID=1929288 RepID=UPI00329F4F89
MKLSSFAVSNIVGTPAFAAPIVAIAMVFGTQASASNATNDKSICHGMVEESTRLSCYDNETGYKAPVLEKAKPASQWTKRVDKSAIDDSKEVYMSVKSKDLLPARFGTRQEARLLLRCMENTTVAYFTWGGHHLADLQSYGKVTYRVDEKKAVTRRFQESTDNQALGLWNGGSSIPFIKQLFDAETLVVRITPYSESPMETTFNISGLETEIAELRDTCSW